MEAADGLYLDNHVSRRYPDLTFYQATPATDPFGNGVFTPEGLYPLIGARRPPAVFELPAQTPTAFRP